MSARPVRIIFVIVGALAVLTGAVWMGQGLNVIPGSAMSGDRTWFYVGTALVVLGGILLVLGLRRVPRKP